MARTAGGVEVPWELRSPDNMLEFIHIIERMTKVDLTIEIDGVSFNRDDLESVLGESRDLDKRCCAIDNHMPLR